MTRVRTKPPVCCTRCQENWVCVSWNVLVGTGGSDKGMWEMYV